jgi:tripartite-type tricarboxylate transporter receptor subunit TctC
VGTSPGGGFDAYARLVAPYLAEELGADVTVENLTGAGGLRQLNTLWVAEPDGTTIGIMNGAGVVGTVLGEAEGIEFELEEFSYLGRVAGEPRVLAVNAGLPYESAEDIIGLEEPFRFSATGPGGGTYNDGVLTCEVFAMPACDVLTGFAGSEEARLAVTAGEADGIVTTADSVLGEIDAGDHRALAVLAGERIEELPDTPTYTELELEGEQLQIAESMTNIVEAGRAFAAPPNMPEDILAELRQAFENVMTSEEFLEDAEAQGRPISYMDGEEMRQVIVAALDAPEPVREILREAEVD